MTLPREACNVIEDKERVMPIDPTKENYFCECESCPFINNCKRGCVRDCLVNLLNFVLSTGHDVQKI